MPMQAIGEKIVAGYATGPASVISLGYMSNRLRSWGLKTSRVCPNQLQKDP